MVDLKMPLMLDSIFVHPALLAARHAVTQALLNAQLFTTDIGWMALLQKHVLLDVRLVLMGPHALLALTK
jgi:hypothetical protein